MQVVQFHPNSNYIVTASTDRFIRMWDNLNGECVRMLSGHKDEITVLAFENSGRFLASSGADKRILVWDIASAHLIADLHGGHTDTILTLAFNSGPEATLLASGGHDHKVCLWDVQALLESVDFESLTPVATPSIKTKSGAFLVSTVRTKSTSILLNQFTRRNLMLSVGVFNEPGKV